MEKKTIPNRWTGIILIWTGIILIALGLLGIWLIYQQNWHQKDLESDSQTEKQIIDAESTSDPLCPDEHHPHIIDLGLPSGTKWACCNIGATKPEESGSHFAWGETEEKRSFDMDNYAYYSEDRRTIGTEIAGTQYDVAFVQWGGLWRMPTLDQIKELVEECKWTWTERNVKNGILLTGPNEKCLFLPAAGYCWGEKQNDEVEGSGGYYWSSTMVLDEDLNSFYIFFCVDDLDWNYFDRFLGLSVRPVCP